MTNSFTLADAILQLIEVQCEVENVSEDAYSVIGPLDIDELADSIIYLFKKGSILDL